MAVGQVTYVFLIPFLVHHGRPLTCGFHLGRSLDALSLRDNQDAHTGSWRSGKPGLLCNARHNSEEGGHAWTIQGGAPVADGCRAGEGGDDWVADGDALTPGELER